jgi:hypothetical protein
MTLALLPSDRLPSKTHHSDQMVLSSRGRKRSRGANPPPISGVGAAIARRMKHACLSEACQRTCTLWDALAAWEPRLARFCTTELRRAG